MGIITSTPPVKVGALRLIVLIVLIVLKFSTPKKASKIAVLKKKMRQ